MLRPVSFPALFGTLSNASTHKLLHTLVTDYVAALPISLHFCYKVCTRLRN